MDGGGIKTKLVEALGYNCSVVSTNSGANGIPLEITAEKMVLVADGDWELFADAIIQINPNIQTPDIYFNHFYWGNITQKAAAVITACR